jgi:hypothetical protein
MPQTQEQYVQDRINHFIKVEGCSDGETVRYLIATVLVPDGKCAWLALKTYKENEQEKAERKYWAIINKLGKDIDDINQTLKGWG